MHTFNKYFRVYHIWGPCLTRCNINFFPCFGSFSCDIPSQPTSVDQKSSLLFGPVQLFLLPMWHGDLPCFLVMLALIICSPASPRWEHLCTVCLTGCLKKKIHTVVLFFQHHILLCLWLGVLFLSPVYAWGCYELWLVAKGKATAWSRLEVQWCLQGSLTPSLSVQFPCLLPTILCFATLTSLLSWLGASYDLAPSQDKLAQLVENQSCE